jgi:putative membrane protein
LHVYNLLGFSIWLLRPDSGIDPAWVLPFMIGLVTGWAVLNTVSSVLLGSPDESALLTVLPGRKFLLAGRGYEGVMIIGAGSLAALFLLVFLAGPLVPQILPLCCEVLHPHLHWILWCVIAFLLLTEWPRRGECGPAGWRLFCTAWSTLSAGILTFLLAGLFGFLLFYRSPVAAEDAFQNLMPAFAGLFAVPWCLLAALFGAPVPPQQRARVLDLNADLLLRGGVAGGIGGGVAAFLPAVTGGVGGLLAGHATAQRDERLFLVSQGASKVVYYAGALLLFFVPERSLTRGGAATLLRSYCEPGFSGGYELALGAVALSGAAAFWLLSPLTRLLLALLRRFGSRRMCAGSLALTVLLVGTMTGPTGLAVMTVGAGIGLLPVLFGSRRVNCLGVLLLPMACNLSGVGESVAAFLGLLP